MKMFIYQKLFQKMKPSTWVKNIFPMFVKVWKIYLPMKTPKREQLNT